MPATRHSASGGQRAYLRTRVQLFIRSGGGRGAVEPPRELPLTSQRDVKGKKFAARYATNPGSQRTPLRKLRAVFLDYVDTSMAFETLEARGRITEAAKAASNDATFSSRIRAGVPMPPPHPDL